MDTPSFVIGPDGAPLTIDDLPAADTRRWVPRRKAQVVAAVEGGLISAEYAFARYAISREEYETWRRAVSRHGTPGLRVTRLREMRVSDE